MKDLQVKIDDIEKREKALKEELAGYQKTFKGNATKILNVLSKNGSLSLKGFSNGFNTKKQWEILKENHNFYGIFERRNGLKTLTAGAYYVIAKAKKQYGDYFTIDNNGAVKFVSSYGNPSTFKLISKKLTDLE